MDTKKLREILERLFKDGYATRLLFPNILDIDKDKGFPIVINQAIKEIQELERKENGQH